LRPALKEAARVCGTLRKKFERRAGLAAYMFYGGGGCTRLLRGRGIFSSPGTTPFGCVYRLFNTLLENTFCYNKFVK
jgi:hypothetical protein